MSNWTCCLALALVAPLAMNVRAAEKYEDLVAAAGAAYRDKQTDKALELLGQAIALRPQESSGYLLRASLFEIERRHAEAVADLSQAIKLDPKDVGAWDRRGSERLTLGKMDEALGDFDQAIKLRPTLARSHWKRGIACYYAKRYDDGRQQFEAYQEFDNADVENAVWRFICMARGESFDAAQKEILKIGNDRRVPMRQIYDLFAGQAQPEDVLKACDAAQGAEKSHQLFYAHQYLGLYYEVKGQAALARQHTKLAADKHKIAHYMWDVARVHADHFLPPAPAQDEK